MCRKAAFILVAALACCSILAPAARALPGQVSYQGQLLAEGQPYTGSAQFKFAIVADAGATCLWSHDGSGGEPATALTVAVDQGIFHVCLGDTATGQVALDALDLGDPTDAMLRVWVDTGTGFVQLDDQPLSAAPFALQADAARRSLGNFQVMGMLDAMSGLTTPHVMTSGFQLVTGPAPGYVLTSDAVGLASWQPAGAGGGDSDWTISGDNMYAGVGGNVGIGTTNPTQKLQVDGSTLFQVAPDRSVTVTTPGGWPGFIALAPNGHRRDILFDDNGIRLLAGGTSSAPSGQSGLAIRENGWVGVLKFNPASALDVAGQTRTESLLLNNSGYNDVVVSSDAATGGKLELNRPTGPFDHGFTATASALNGGAVVDLFNADNAATVEMIGHQTAAGGGMIALGSGTRATVFLDGDHNGGGRTRLTNNAGTVTYQTTGQAFGNASQVNMYDGAGQIAQQWTAANREWKLYSVTGVAELVVHGAGAGGDLALNQSDGQTGVFLDGDSGGHGEVVVHDHTGTATVRLIGNDGTGNGRVVTDVLEITGGADLSENFDINAGAAVQPGTVVCIDPDDPGRLIPSGSPYQRTVAGVVSGAGGVRPGLLMGQQGTAADGAHPVALTGRVWTLCDASAGPIRPGDLLTTAPTAGHAMKVADHEKAQGAIVGKAMSKLEAGQGLVLVLVSLQ